MAAFGSGKFAFNPKFMHDLGAKATHLYIAANNIQDLGQEIVNGEKVIKKVSIVLESNKCKHNSLSVPHGPMVIQVESVS